MIEQLKKYIREEMKCSIIRGPFRSKTIVIFEVVNTDGAMQNVMFMNEDNNTWTHWIQTDGSLYSQGTWSFISEQEFIPSNEFNSLIDTMPPEEVYE